MGSGGTPSGVTTRSIRRTLKTSSLEERCVHGGVVAAHGLLCDGDQADWMISTGKLHASRRFHIRPIDVVVYHDPLAKPCFEVSFPLRCFQRLSIPHIATLLRGWRHDRSTRGVSIPVLSY